MSLPALNSACRLVAATVLTSALAISGWAQDSSQSSASSGASEPRAVQAPQPQEFVLKDYSKPVSAFPNVLRPYAPQHVPPPNLSNTSRIGELMHDGKIMLSIDDAVALALENNLDIGIARYNLNIADTDVLRAKSGANNFLGANSGVVQNTPGSGVGGLGGTVGSGAGGTTAAPGGIGAGTNGLVSSSLGLGSPITSFDPILTSTIQEDHNSIISSNVFTGAPTVSQNTGTYNFNYAQGFQWGTNMSVGFTNSRITTNNVFNTYSPQISPAFQFRLTQHLLQGFGFLPNTRLIRLTKNNREISDVAFRLQTITTVDQIENMYWDLVFAYENVRVQQESLAFAQKTLSDTQKQVQIGSLAPIEVVRAQNTVATDQQSLIQAQNNLQLQQLLMKNALSRTLVDPRLADAEVIPTSTIQLSAQEEVTPTQDLVNDALGHRPELAEARINLASQEVSNKAVRSALLPTLDLFAYYGGSGLAGSQNQANLCANLSSLQQAFGCAGPPIPVTSPSYIPPAQPVSYGTALNQTVDSSAPDKGVGVTLNIPIRNRA